MKNFFNQIPQLFYIFFSLAVITLGIVIFFFQSMKGFDDLADESMGYIKEAFSKEIGLLEDKTGNLSDQQLNTLAEKVEIIELQKEHHLGLVKTLFRNNYATYTVFPILSGITAILAFFVISYGWGNANLFLRVYFIYFTILTAITGVYPQVYQQNENIEKNLESYRDYQALQKSIFNYASTAPYYEGKDSVPFIEFLDNINLQEKKLSKHLDFVIEKQTIGREVFDGVTPN